MRHEEVDDGLAGLGVVVDAYDLGRAELRGARRGPRRPARASPPPAPGLQPTALSPGACSGFSATPTTDCPDAGRDPSWTTSGVSRPPAATSSAARWPTTSSAAEAGSTATAGSSLIRAVVRSSASITVPRGISVVATSTCWVLVDDDHAQAARTAPRQTARDGAGHDGRSTSELRRRHEWRRGEVRLAVDRVVLLCGCVAHPNPLSNGQLVVSSRAPVLHQLRSALIAPVRPAG